MKLKTRTISDLAEMICGASGGGGGFRRQNFPYRSSSYLTEFFQNCDLDYSHDGATRKWWVQNVLDELNTGPATNPQLPPDGIVRVLKELTDPSEFAAGDLERSGAIEELNASLSREGLQIYIDGAGRSHVRNVGSDVSSANLPQLMRAWTPEERRRRKALSEYLDKASEDEFTEEVLFPLFRQLGFARVSVAGHKDKALEYGKDIWMKYQLPTQHWIYFGVQAKIGKLDSAGKTKGGNTNITEVLNQVRMALAHPILDPETNKKNLLDHVFVVSAGEITKQARNLLGEKLDQDSRRHVLFMDRDDIVNLTISTNLKVAALDDEHAEDGDDEIPF